VGSAQRSKKRKKRARVQQLANARSKKKVAISI